MSPTASSDVARAPRQWTLAALTIGGFLLLVVGVAAAYKPSVHPDSGTYLDLSFTGDAPRLWTVPLLYKLAPTDRLRELAQAGVAVAAWLFLMRQVLQWVTDRTLSRWVAAAVLGLGLTQQVLQWNVAMLSESVAITTAVALLAATLLLVREPRWRWVFLWALVFALWLFTRQLHALTGGVLVVPLLAYAVARRDARMKLGALCALLLVITAWGLVCTARGATGIARLNAAEVIHDRIAPSEERLAYFTARGMPAEAAEADRTYGDLTRDPEVALWIDEEWSRVYIGYLLTHPAALAAPLQYINEVLSPESSYTGVTPVLPPPLEGIYYGPGVIVFYSTVLAAVVVRQSRRRPLVPLEWIGLAVVAFSVLWYSAMWLNATVDLGRLGAPMSVLMRLGILLALLPTAQELMAARRQARATISSR